MKTNETIKPRNLHLIKSWKNFYNGYWGITFLDNAYKVLSKKEAWQQGYITWLDFHYSGCNGSINNAAAWDEIFTRWVKLKKKCSKKEVINFLKQMELRICNCGKWYQSRGNYIIHSRCGIIYSNELRSYEKAPYKCALCGKIIEGWKDYIFCDKHLKSYFKYSDKNNLEYNSEETQEAFVLNKIAKASKQIERGTYHGIDRTGN